MIPERITHIQYADDTVVMVDPSLETIRNLKLILYCFEFHSSLKINFYKSEVYTFGMSQEEEWMWANMLNCKVGSLPMTYLGIPISDHILRMVNFDGLVLKMGKRLDPWKGKHNSPGGRLILSNTCLSSLPIYMMGFYFLYGGTHRQMDSIRSNFFWQGAEESHKYHMMNWEAVCRPKYYGGLEILNTKIMNECLLVKWI